ncbi:MAG TPA: formyltransferase family protein [Polyangia bacterium]|jgi:methionyl-tRNA formyltransferase|nr:formyltransferase family protein [Polyangia bacterium]
MRLLFAGNNWLGLEALRFLRSQGEEIVGLALHPSGKRRYGDELLAASGLSTDAILDGTALNTPEGLAATQALRADACVSVLFNYLFKAPFLASFPRGVVNLHPSLLPYNRGQYPNVWSIIEGTPSGVTFHYVDAGVDTGDIIAQRAVDVTPIDTGQTLYRKLELAGLELFREAWPAFRDGTAARRPQSGAAGTSHRTSDVDRVDEIDLDASTTGRALIDLLRARTFPPYRGAYFKHDGRKVYLRLQLDYEEDEP